MSSTLSWKRNILAEMMKDLVKTITSSILVTTQVYSISHMPLKESTNSKRNSCVHTLTKKLNLTATTRVGY